MEEPCATLKKLAEELMISKKEGAQPEALRKQLMVAALAIMQVNSRNRTTCEASEAAREATLASKGQLDNASLALQNLLYEKHHYTNEIRACRNFRSKWSDKEVGLMPEADFRAEAPAQFQAGLEDPHETMKQRLRHERHARQEMLKSLEGLRAQRDLMSNTAGNKRTFLANLQESLGAVRAAVAGVREQLGGAPARRRAPLGAAAGLPGPLYTAYAQAVGAAEAFDLDIEVGVAGTSDDADPPSSGQPEADEGAKPGSKRERTGSATAPGEPAPKRSRSASPDMLWRVHPLGVRVRLAHGAGTLCVLRLAYVPGLRVVTACCTDPADSALLGLLVGGDDGAKLPSEAAVQLAGGAAAWDASRADKPYRWAQQLAGLHHLPADGPAGAGAGTPAAAQAILERLRAAKLAALNA